ncbi:MAG: hypothetical protein ABIG64_01540 [Candidatus Omnitrophota bacterium]
MYTRKISGLRIIQRSWLGCFNLIFGKPVIVYPFLFISILELISILTLFLFIQPPLVKYINPIVLRFWGEKFLHYPLNLVLLSRLFSYLQLAVLVIFGTFATGMTINMSADYFLNNQFSFKKAVLATITKYVSLLIISLLIFFLLHQSQVLENRVLLKILNRGRSFLGVGVEDWKTLFLVFSVVVSGIIQTIFIFIQPAIMIENKNFFLAIFRNLSFVMRNLFSALILTIIPLTVFIPVVLLKSNMIVLMNRLIPEIVFIILIAGVFISFFINLVITISITKAYLVIKNDK